jgi:hypothetical protein
MEVSNSRPSCGPLYILLIRRILWTEFAVWCGENSFVVVLLLQHFSSSLLFH